MCANICFPHWSWQICSWKSLHTERGKGREGWGREREKFSLELSKLNPSYSPRGIGNWNLRQFYVFFFSLFSHFCSSNEATADLPRLTCPFMFKWAADLTLCFVELSKLLIPCAFHWPQEDERGEEGGVARECEAAFVFRFIHYLSSALFMPGCKLCWAVQLLQVWPNKCFG